MTPQEASAELRALARTLRDKVDTRSPEYDAVKIRFSTMLAVAYLDAVNDLWDESFRATPSATEERRIAIDLCRKETGALPGDRNERWVLHGSGGGKCTVAVHTLHGDSRDGYPIHVPCIDTALGEARPLWTFYVEKAREEIARRLAANKDAAQ